LAETWAAKYGPKGARVKAVSPGAIGTEGRDAMGEGLEQFAAQVPAGRLQCACHEDNSDYSRSSSQLAIRRRFDQLHRH
jgi:NAD(P)-dependent dehydrogenase (short-subunit alcohol dehydrogenase family)